LTSAKGNQKKIAQSSTCPALCGAGADFDLADAGLFNAAGFFITNCFLCEAFGAPAPASWLAMLGCATSIKLGTSLL
tara:strand:+ start:1853 stop:2083 length:231 start_codon:yes stop_codon:yes gene_type:complete